MLRKQCALFTFGCYVKQIFAQFEVGHSHISEASSEKLFPRLGLIGHVHLLYIQMRAYLHNCLSAYVSLLCFVHLVGCF
jgi:hypothetical protein